MHGFYERKQVDIYWPVFIFKAETPGASVISSRKVYSLSVHYPRAEREPLSRIVIAADNEYLSAALGKPVYEVIKKAHGFCRRDRLVIDVSGDQNSLRSFLFYYSENSFQYVSLIFDHRIVIDALSQMQI